MALITIKTFQNSVDAHIFKAKLESEGIRCYLFDENTVSVNPLYNITVGGIKLNINEKDLEKAKEVYAELNSTPYTDEQDEIIHCPKCNSSNIYSGFHSYKGIKGFFSVIITVLFAVFPLYSRKIYKCKDCNNGFKLNEIKK